MTGDGSAILDSMETLGVRICVVCVLHMEGV